MPNCVFGLLMITYLHLMKAISKLANGIQLLFEFSLVKVCNHLRYACNFELLKLETDRWFYEFSLHCFSTVNDKRLPGC